MAEKSKIPDIERSSVDKETSLTPARLPEDPETWLLREWPRQLPEIQRVSEPDAVRIKDRIKNGSAYDMHFDLKGRRGRAICFHMEHVSEERIRHGDEHDVVALKHIFENDKLSFEFQEYKDLTADEIRQTLKIEASRKELEDIAVLFIFVMSHGKKDYFTSSDGEDIHTLEILGAFNGKNCKFMTGKPKAFFIVAGQNRLEKYQDTSTLDKELSPDTTSTEDDAMMHMQHWLLSICSYPGTHNFRLVEYGSPYIQALCYVISRDGHQLHLTELLDQTAALVNNHGYGCRQLPVMKSTLNKAVYLCPGLPTIEPRRR